MLPDYCKKKQISKNRFLSFASHPSLSFLFVYLLSFNVFPFSKLKKNLIQTCENANMRYKRDTLIFVGYQSLLRKDTFSRGNKTAYAKRLKL
jgi:hypothetical protein